MVSGREFTVAIGTPKAEEELARRSKPQDACWEDVLKRLQFPEDLHGIRVLDIGAGASDFIPHILELGADAYALDPKYRRMSDFRGEVRKYHKTLTAARMPRERIKRLQKALETFTECAKNYPERFVSAYASSLPFADGDFDVVCSINALTVYPDVDPHLFPKIVSEALRVTRRGGTLQFYPYLLSGVGFGGDPYRLRNQEQTLGKAQEKGITEPSEFTTDEYGVRTIILVKR